MGLIWQLGSVYQPTYDFRVILDRDFVEKVISLHVPLEGQRRMNELGSEVIRRFGHKNTLTPYLFDKDSAFVRNFSLGENGAWLSVDNCQGKSPLEIYKSPKNIPFSSHNVNNSSQAYALMSLVDMWASYVPTIRGE